MTTHIGEIEMTISILLFCVQMPAAKFSLFNSPSRVKIFQFDINSFQMMALKEETNDTILHLISEHELRPFP